MCDSKKGKATRAPFLLLIHLPLLYNVKVVPVARDIEGNEKKEKATINLTDCLACSGCITSAESVLVSSQSKDLVVDILLENRKAQRSEGMF